MSCCNGMAVQYWFCGVYPIPDRMYRVVSSGVSGMDDRLKNLFV